ncbi:MAG: AAC(3) family N-acetyltransferase [Bacteroidetes bacterium]|nr:AAC(3) family N-acetyltransferase [Bacteroidota bacterium]
MVYLSSDIRKLAYQARKHKETFDPQAFLNALKQKLGPEGTILIPTFNYTLRNGDAFDPEHTAPITGTLSAEALRNEGFRRTKNPMHSFAVWGKGQAEILALENKSSFGIDSPFHWMYQHHALLLGIDVDLQQSLTFAHYAEEMSAVGYRRQKSYTIQYVEQGKTGPATFHIFSKKPGYVNQVNPLLDEFRGAGIITEFTVNAVPCFVLDLHASAAIMKNDLERNKAAKMTYFSWNVFFRSIARSVLGK